MSLSRVPLCLCRSKGVKDRTCGSYCTYVHNLLRTLADRIPPGALNEDGTARRKEGLNKEDIQRLLTDTTDEAAQLVKQSKKGRYLRSFKEFLGMKIDPKVPKPPLSWIDKLCAQYK